ncbi:MAG: RNA polymerase sigma factor [Prevotella sp.]|nr:RNA polymerase sigma factor [Prevotella sp.]
MNTEQQLLKRINDGDAKAQEELYRRYAGTAMAVAMRLVADSDAAADVLQEAFVKVFLRIGSFSWRGEGTLKAWVMRIVSNEAVDFMRQRQQLAYTELPDDELPDDEDPDVEGIPIDVLQSMIEQLPPGYRMVFTLYVLQQLSHKEIAAMMGIRESSSSSQLIRAKKMLARAINKYKKEHEI